MQSFSAPTDQATPVNTLKAYHTIIQSENSPTSEHVWQYIGPQASEIFAIIPEVGEGVVGRKDLVNRRRRDLHPNGSEWFDTIFRRSNVSHW